MSNVRTEVFTYLAQCDSTVTVTTAWINPKTNVVHKDYVVVSDASPRVVREIVNTFKLVSLNTDGLMIPVGEV